MPISKIGQTGFAGFIIEGQRAVLAAFAALDPEEASVGRVVSENPGGFGTL